jgi:hypothetical protein
MADKVSNLRSMLWDYRQLGEKLWERFNSSKEQQTWYNGAMKATLAHLREDAAAAPVWREMCALLKVLFGV